MLFNQLSYVLVCSFWIDEGKDRQTLENVEQKSSKPYRQLALCGSGDCFCSEKNGKKYQKDNIKTIIHFYLTIPKITSGAMVISVTAQRLLQIHTFGI